MTIRDKLNRHKRKWMGAFFLCFLLFGVIGMLAEENKAIEPLIPFVFAAAAGCMIALQFGNKCAKCKRNLGHAINWPPAFLGVSKAIKFCPYCGVDLDTELKE